MHTISTSSSKIDSFRIDGRYYRDADALPFRVWLRVLKSMIVQKMQKRRTRMHLSELTDEQLDDIGVTRREARFEFRRSYPHWFFDGR